MNRQASGVNLRPTPDFSGLIGLPSSKPVSSWIRPLNEEEITKIRAEQEQFSKKKALTVKTRRFLIRNTAIITASLIALIVLLLIVRGTIRQRAELPSTRGLDPIEVAEAYYAAFNDLDHTMMDACVSGKAGKGDIEIVVNFFVINKVRETYEGTKGSFMRAREWIESGRPFTEQTVFGITDLIVRVLSEGSKDASFEADYTLWMPGEYPEGMIIKDRLDLVFNKGIWRIANISRSSSAL
jgi:hypothetical protein